MYLLPSSSHPAHVSNNIPYSLAYRIVRICSKPELRDAQFLKPSIVDSAIVRAKAIPREVALKKIERKEKPDRVIITLENHGPGSLDEGIFSKSSYGYRRPPNLRDKLIRARIPDPPRLRPKRLIPCMKPVIQSSNTSKKIEINGTFNCKTRNVVYCITCQQCKL